MSAVRAGVQLDPPFLYPTAFTTVPAAAVAVASASAQPASHGSADVAPMVRAVRRPELSVAGS